MRLLTTDGDLRLEDFADAKAAPDYAILSHRWGQCEVTYQDLQRPDFAPLDDAQNLSWSKICNSRNTARHLGFSHIWIDSCCIDQKSSAELSESINSMYSWYENAGLCIAYLMDDDGTESSFEKSVWWTRGWTLQELIAPKELLFYSSDWKPRHTRFQKASLIEKMTGISSVILEKPSRKALRELSVATKLSWATRRETAKEEDQAYSLLGLFEIHMATLYGEGRHNALWRLQMEIYHRTSDHTLFAWDRYTASQLVSNILASQLKDFEDLKLLHKTTYQDLGLDVNQATRVTHAYSASSHGLCVQFLYIPKSTISCHFSDDVVQYLTRDSPKTEKVTGYLILACRNELKKLVFVPVRILESGQVLRHGDRFTANSHIDSRQLQRIDVYLTAPSVYPDVELDALWCGRDQQMTCRASIFDEFLTSSDGLGLRCSKKPDVAAASWEMKWQPAEILFWRYASESHGTLEISVKESGLHRCRISIRTPLTDCLEGHKTLPTTEREVMKSRRFLMAAMRSGVTILANFHGEYSYTETGRLGGVLITVRLEVASGVSSPMSDSTKKAKLGVIKNS